MFFSITKSLLNGYLTYATNYSQCSLTKRENSKRERSYTMLHGNLFLLPEKLYLWNRSVIYTYTELHYVKRQAYTNELCKSKCTGKTRLVRGEEKKIFKFLSLYFFIQTKRYKITWKKFGFPLAQRIKIDATINRSHLRSNTCVGKMVLRKWSRNTEPRSHVF